MKVDCTVGSNSAILWTACSLSRSSVHGILQVRVLEWVAISFSRTQGSNPGLPPCGRILYQLSHKGSHSQGKSTCNFEAYCNIDLHRNCTSLHWPSNERIFSPDVGHHSVIRLQDFYQVKNCISVSF